MLIDEARLHELRALGRDDPALLGSLVSIFIEDTTERLAAAQAALAAVDLSRLRALGHALAGSGGILGLTRLAALGSALERGALAGDLDTARGAVGDIARELPDIIEVVRVEMRADA